MIASPEPSVVVLDNQAIEVTIEIPSGRFRILDKISSLEWVMNPAPGCGRVLLKPDRSEKTFTLGSTGDQAVSFETNYYMVRSTDGDDFHDVMLNALLPDLGASITLRFLLSFSEPVLDCFLYADDTHAPTVSRIEYPQGLVPSSDAETHVWLPDDVRSLAKPDAPIALWEPPRTQRHAVAGTPFFIVTAEHEDQQSSCIGLLTDPHYILLVDDDPKQPSVTPCSPQPDKTGATDERPFHFRYRIAPTTDAAALIWLCREAMLSAEQPLVL